ncbi:MAG TPA: hydroxymethylbilane synthase [Acidimicrobiales bacterium]|nr:hydroxymethylbilane synthase [Acidimicrobiales bacterium]
MSLPAGARVVRLATRGSPLALAQADIVARLLEAREPELRVARVVVRTEGDRRTEEDLDRIGGQGVFVKEVQGAVLDGRADVAVHSAKDLPPRTPEGLVLAAVPARADPRDAMVGATLGTLVPGAVVATGSARRRAQLANIRPDLGFVGLRGNMATRLDRVGDGTVAAVVAAAAALDRLGWEHRIAERLSPVQCLPQAGQGALALECREDDAGLLALLACVDVRDDHRALDAERAFLRTLGAGCAVPAGALARPVRASPDRDIADDTDGDDPDVPGELLELEGVLASADGRVVVRGRCSGGDPDALGEALAWSLVRDRGASSLSAFEELPLGPATA